MYKCKECDFETDKKQTLGAHITNIHREKPKLFEKRTVKKECKKCSKEFEVLRAFDLKNQKWGSTIGERNFCSTKCAKSREWSEELRNKLSESCKNSEIIKERSLKQKSLRLLKKCTNCGKEMPQEIYKRKTCSEECFRKRIIHGAHKGGLIGAATVVKRSKAEIYFFELCQKHYKNIEHNVPIFDGWDADIILHDFKIAILYNGKWHYEKLKEKHSLKQVQNRDRIKIKKILTFGYKPYIIKDMGKFNKKFVENQFENFQKRIKDIAG